MTASSPAPERELVGWYAAHGRHHLPWRASRDRWEVLVSEVMLTQTQAGRVAAVWERFVTRFPDPPSGPGRPGGRWPGRRRRPVATLPGS
ncbi:MAG: hypothetical protein ACRDY7_16735 [Acidimicrobiia bacterium]